MATDSEVAAAGFTLPVGTDLVAWGDNAITRNAHAAFALKYNFEQTIPSGTDIKTLMPGVYTVTSGTLATSLGLPIAAPGNLTVGVVSTQWNARNHLYHAHPAAGAPSRIFVRNLLSGKWSDWREMSWSQGGLPGGTDLNDVTTPGYYGLSPNGSVYEIYNKPIEDFNGAILEVFDYAAARVQRFTSISYSSPSVWSRRINVGGPYGVWIRTDPGGIDLTAGSGGSSARRELLQQRLRARKGNTIGTGGIGAVALRFDDAPEEFVSKVLPLLEARSLPFTRVSTSESINGYVIPASAFPTMQDYCIRAGGEVWNHGKTHDVVDTMDGVNDEVLGALDTLRSKMPRIPIDCWTPAGGQSTGWLGYMPADSIEKLADTYTGQQIMANHALSSGYLPDSWTPTLDGVMRDGGIAYSSDIRDLAFVTNVLDRARDFPSGITLMFHANNIDTDGYISMADFIGVLDYIVAERDAGRLLVLTVSGLAVADSSSSQRRDVLRTHGGAVWSESVPYPAFRPELPGATLELTAKVTGTTGATVTSVVGESTKTHTIPAGGTLRLRHPATVPLDATSLPVSITGGTTADAHLYPV